MKNILQFMLIDDYTQPDGEHRLRDYGARSHEEHNRQPSNHSRRELYADEGVGHPWLRQDTAFDAPQQQGSQRGRDRRYDLRLLRCDAGDYILRAVEVSHGLTHGAYTEETLAASDRTERYISASRADERSRAREKKEMKIKAVWTCYITIARLSRSVI